MAIEVNPSANMLAEKPYPVVHDAEVSYEGSSAIPVKYRGSTIDYEDMRVLGKKQVLRRNFKFFTMLGFASAIMCSWEFILPLFVFALTDGGTALLFWGFIAISIILMLVYASLAELASMSPTAGGQYHWVSELTPPKWQKPLSYVVGWLTTIGWQTYLCGSTFACALIIQGLIALNVDDYVWHNWHGTLLTIALIVTVVILNIVLGKVLPLINGSILVLHFIGFVAVFTTLWAIGHHASPQVLIEFSNSGGWPTTGLSAMVGLISPLSVLIGFDCSVHMSEEIQDASITLPRAMMSSVFLNMLMAFLMITTAIFNAGNIEDLLSTDTRQPFIQLFYNTTRSYAATNALTAIVIVMLFGNSISQVTASSRQLWSFARDGGVPAASLLSKVSTKWDMPLPAVCVSVVSSSALACINIGSSTALNVLAALGLVAILTSYVVTIGCLIWRRLAGPPLPPRRWSLGKFGLPINVAAVTLLMPLWFFVFWPPAIPVTPTTMNWSSTIFCGLIILALVYYAIHGRKVYDGPVMYVKRHQ